MSSGPSLSGEAALAAHFSALDLSPGGLLSVVLSVTLALAVTVTLTLEIKARLDKARRERAFKALFRAVDLKLKGALLATGSAQINAAAALVNECSCASVPCWPSQLLWRAPSRTWAKWPGVG